MTLRRGHPMAGRRIFHLRPDSSCSHASWRSQRVCQRVRSQRCQDRPACTGGDRCGQFFLNHLADYLARPCKTDRDKARAAYRWITDRIAYDAEAFFTGKRGDNSTGWRSEEARVSVRRLCRPLRRAGQAFAVANGASCGASQGFRIRCRSAARKSSESRLGGGVHRWPLAPCRANLGCRGHHEREVRQALRRLLFLAATGSAPVHPLAARAEVATGKSPVIDPGVHGRPGSTAAFSSSACRPRPSSRPWPTRASASSCTPSLTRPRRQRSWRR